MSGIPKSELSDLAGHHYLVTFIGWQLARRVQANGARINIGRVLEFCLVNDLGELFGGDIAMPYARRNPKARQKAKAFERENQHFLARFFGQDKTYVKKLMAETMDAKSDEAVIAKLADYIEVTHYKAYIKILIKDDITMAKEKIVKTLKKLQDPIARRTLNEFTKQWLKAITQKKSIFELLKL